MIFLFRLKHTPIALARFHDFYSIKMKMVTGAMRNMRNEKRRKKNFWSFISFNIIIINIINANQRTHKWHVKIHFLCIEVKFYTLYFHLTVQLKPQIRSKTAWPQKRKEKICILYEFNFECVKQREFFLPNDLIWRPSYRISLNVSKFLPFFIYLYI